MTDIVFKNNLDELEKTPNFAELVSDLDNLLQVFSKEVQQAAEKYGHGLSAQVIFQLNQGKGT